MRGEKVMNKIRKIMTLILLTVLSVMLISCGNQENGSADPGAISAYTGFWKYETQPMYLTIDEQYQWTMTDFYGNQTDGGTVDAEADAIALYTEDGSLKEMMMLSDTGLIDESGNTLVASEALVYLPTPSDELNLTATFPGNFASVQINYPVQLISSVHGTYTDTLGFDAQMKYGTDDAHTNIIIGFQPISGYDDNMTKGIEVAKPQMEQMMQTLLNNMYGGNVIQIIGSECTDCGSYYRIVGSVWMNSSIFGDGSSDQIRGNFEVRYYGPTNYALVAMTIAPESRIENYVGITNNMLNTCTYTAGWSTAPKAVPEAPPQDAKKKSDGASDDGVAYYWYDSDGDLWYWDGSDNYFIGYGDAGYDDDYYEANDYDPWSDPGDYGDDYYDYDDDYYDYGDDDWDYYDNNDDYAYDDDGWGDYFD